MMPSPLCWCFAFLAPLSRLGPCPSLWPFLPWTVSPEQSARGLRLTNLPIGGGNGAHFNARTSCPVLATRFLLPKLLSGRHRDTPVLGTGLPPGSLPCHFTNHSLTAGIPNKDLCLWFTARYDANAPNPSQEQTPVTAQTCRKRKLTLAEG